MDIKKRKQSSNLNSSSSSSLSTYCAILPSNSPTLSQDIFNITETDVICPDLKFENTCNFNFQHVFNGIKELQTSFEKYYAPIVRQTALGESNILVFCGLPISESIEYFTTINGKVGFISQAAQILLRAAIVDGQNPGIVTLSWYKIDCNNSESITDLLKSSSPLHNQKGSDPNLILRELGKGRGMIIPGLWEVELTTPQDVDAVINHVHRMLPSSQHDGLSHTVFQLTIAPHDTQSKSTHLKPGNKTTVNDDSPGVGRLSIVLLSNLSQIKNLSYTENFPSHQSLFTSPQGEYFSWIHLMNDILHWMENRRPSPPYHKSRLLLLLRDALCSRMSSIFTLFLSPTISDLPDNSSWLDLITRINHITQDRSQSNYTIKQNPLSTIETNNLRESAITALSITNQQQQQQQQMNSNISPKRERSNSISNVGIGLTNNNNNNNNVNNIQNVNNNGNFQDRIRSKSKSPDRQKDKEIKNQNNNYKQQYVSDNRDILPFNHQQQYLNDYNDISASALSISSLQSEQQQQQQQQFKNQYNQSKNIQENRLSQQFSNNLPERNEQKEYELSRGNVNTKQSYQYSIMNDNNNDNNHNNKNNNNNNNKKIITKTESLNILDEKNDDEENLYHNTNTYTNSNRLNSLQSSQQMQPNQKLKSQRDQKLPPPPPPYSPPPQSSNIPITTSTTSTIEPQIVYVPTLPEGAIDAEGACALIASLEALRNEVNSLRQALAASQQSAAYYKAECKKLVDIHREEGSTLRQQDRAKLKSTLQDLKDYEVYREVMESAMTRMQNEMDLVEKENHEIKEVQKQLEKELRKVKSLHSKSVKDLETSQKLRKEATKKLEVAEEQLRNISKEREVSVNTLSQFKSEKSRELGELQTNNHKKDMEIKNLKKKLIEVESKLQTTINENSASKILHDQEINKLRVAHNKSLEMLMSYQEENELLRSAMSDLVEKHEENDERKRRNSEVRISSTTNYNNQNNNNGNSNNGNNGNNINVNVNRNIDRGGSDEDEIFSPPLPHDIKNSHYISDDDDDDDDDYDKERSENNE